MPRSINIYTKNKKILIGSIVISILLHAAEIHFLQRQALWFSSPTPIEAESWSAAMDKQARTQILKESFTKAVSVSSSVLKTKEVALPQPAYYKEVTQQKLEAPSPQIVPFVLDRVETSTALHTPSPANIFFSIPKMEFRELLPPEKTYPEATLAQVPQFIPTLSAVATPLEKANFSTAINVKTISSQPLAKLPSLSDLQTLSSSAFFDTELIFWEEEKDRYFFALTLIPKPSLQLSSFKQNYVFLIDRSNSIQKERLTVTKQAVHKALEELNPGDRFNIFVFDQKLEKLFTNPLAASPDSIAKARRFLDKIELGSFFSQTSLYKPLLSALNFASTEEEINTVILFSDGASLAQTHELYDLTHQWTQFNNGKTTLYTVNLASDANIEALYTVSQLNRGNITSSPTNKGIKRKLLKLMKTIHTPIAKNLSCKAIAKSAFPIDILPKSNNAPHLYLHEPYTILGVTQSLDDFVLFVQGRLNGKWLHIKKQISFVNGKKGDSSLKEGWAEYQALALYRQYLDTQDPALFEQAQKLIAEHELPKKIEGLFFQ